MGSLFNDAWSPINCHAPFPRLCSHPIDRCIVSPHRPHRSPQGSCDQPTSSSEIPNRAVDPPPPELPTWSAPTTPDCTPWTFPHCKKHHCEIISRNAHPQAWWTWPHPEITCASRDNRATMRHSCHLVGWPLGWWTWALRVPTLILSNLFLSYCVLICHDLFPML